MYDVLVVGIPDEKYGQAVAAVVELREGDALELEELRSFLREFLSGYKLPRALTVVDQIPRNATGKAQYPGREGAGDGRLRRHSTRRRWCERCARRSATSSGSSTRSSRSPRRSRSPPRCPAPAGSGVLGCVRFNDTDELEQTLTWLDDNTDGKPYGVDVVMPMKIPTEGKAVDLKAMIPEEHLSFVERTLQQLGVPPLPEGEGREGVLGWLHSVARSHVDVALNHRPVLIANALGSPPVDVIEKGHEHGDPGRRAGRRRQARASHVANGVDIIVAQGYEAGGHTGEIASMVLQPEIVDAVGPDVPVLGAGGIGCGRQVAASLALGAQGVWTGSIWLGTEEYRTSSPTPDGRRRSPGRPRRTPCAPGSTPASRRGCSRPSGPRRGPRRTRPSRCRCRCRTCWSPTRTTGSTPPTTRT